MSINKSLVERRFAARLSSYNRYASVQNQICEYLGVLADKYVSKEVKKVLEVGAGTGFLTATIMPKFPLAKWYVNDITPEVRRFIDSINVSSDLTYVFGDAEHIEFEEDLDLVISSSAVQWFDNLERFISKLSITQDGFLILSSFGEQNFQEIYQTIGVGLKYKSLEELTTIVKGCKFDILHAEQQQIILEFDTPIDVLKHIKMTGVNSIDNFTWTRTRLNQFCDVYKEQFTNKQGKVTLTYNPTIIIAGVSNP